MFKFSDILGTFMQSSMSGSTTSRMQHAMRAGGRSSQGSLEELLGGGSGMGDALSGLTGGAKGGGIGGMLQDVLGDAGKALGGGNKLALGGLGALAGSLLGGGGGSFNRALFWNRPFCDNQPKCPARRREGFYITATYQLSG